MANATSPNTPQYVQQAFNWDLGDADTNGVELGETCSGSRAGFRRIAEQAETLGEFRYVNSTPFDADSVSGKTPTALADALSSARTQRSNRQPITVPTYATSTSARRGRCEHVGGILASVLERYGIGIDQLIAELDGMK